MYMCITLLLFRASSFHENQLIGKAINTDINIALY